MSQAHGITLMPIATYFMPLSTCVVPLADHIAQLEGTPATAASEYEFTRWEERILEVVMDSMRAAGIMAAIQAISTALLGATLEVNIYGRKSEQ